jgi:S1-C subfamily serine protease
MESKRPVEVFGGFNDKGILEVLTSTANSDDVHFVKLYPPMSRIPDAFKNPENTPRNDDKKQNNGPVATGTGFLISGNGYVATNAHVVEGANAVTVDFIDAEEIVHQYKARIVKTDSANDVAVIKIDDDKFVPFDGLPYSIESRVNIGASVFTIGFPLNSVMGTNFKVSDGIVSAKTGVNDDVRYYQISVPIQPGNSGGPLFNKNGDVVGLTTARLSSEYVGTRVENVNYAIKSMYLLNLIDMVPNFGDLSDESKLIDKSLEEQVEVLKQYVCLIRIY